MCSLFGNPVTVHKDDLGAVAITFALQMRLRTKHIAVNYHHFRSFIANGDIDIQNIYTKEQIADIFTKPLDSELFGYLLYNINGW